MWTKLSHSIIKWRLPLIIILGLITVVTGYYATKVETTYNYFATVPADDPQTINLENFRAEFGQDGTVVALGLLDSSIYTPVNFRKLKEFSEELKTIKSVNEVISIATIVRLESAPVTGTTTGTGRSFVVPLPNWP